MDKILIIGFRGVGKSTVGRALAERLKWNFIDLDEEIENREGKTIAELVRERGWSYFRELERKALRDLETLERVVCALGGGSVLHEEEMRALKEKSLVIWLKADLETIKNRLINDPKTLSQRPALTNRDPLSEAEQVYREREPLYQAYADFIIEIKPGLDVNSIVEQVLNHLREILPLNSL